MRAGQLDRAEAMLEEYYKQAGGDNALLFQVAEHYGAVSNDAKAVEVLTAVRQRFSTPPEMTMRLRARSRAAMASWRGSAGRSAGSGRDYDSEAADRDPDRAGRHEHRLLPSPFQGSDGDEPAAIPEEPAAAAGEAAADRRSGCGAGGLCGGV